MKDYTDRLKQLAFKFTEENDMIGQPSLAKINKNESALSTMVGGNHYKGGSIQPLEFYDANPQLNFQQCNIIKYAYRHKDKNGLQDLLKVIHYAIIEAEFNYGDDSEGIVKFKEDIYNLLKK